eukprot:scaffold212300_cov41-Tisochrysis_lutea.AAC.3
MRPTALVQNCDMNEEMRQDCVDLVITACERYAGNFEVSDISTICAHLMSLYGDVGVNVRRALDLMRRLLSIDPTPTGWSPLSDGCEAG